MNAIRLHVRAGPIALVDHAGRNPFLLAGSAGMAGTLGVMAVVFATAGIGANGRPLLSSAAAVTGLAAANLYIVAFAISRGQFLIDALLFVPNKRRFTSASPHLIVFRDPS
jgi:Sugar (and other) transporter